MNKFVLKNTFIKVYIHHYSINIFCNNKRSKLYFGDSVAVLNVSFFRTEGVPQIRHVELWTQNQTKL
jgi:hypothetical protein